MSKYETPMIDRWWADSQMSGVMAEEYPLVAKSGLVQRRRADGVAVLDTAGEQRTVDWRDLPDLTGKDVVVVQAKASRLCAPLAGQAIGSAWLLEKHAPASIRSVLLCTQDEPTLRPLVEDRGIEVVVMPEFARGGFHLTPSPSRLEAWHQRVGGMLWRQLPDTAWPPLLRPHALHAHVAESVTTAPAALNGLDVTVVTAPRIQSKGGSSFGMYAVGMALLYRDLARRRGAVASSVILTETTDPAMGQLCANFGIGVEQVDAATASR